MLNADVEHAPGTSGGSTVPARRPYQPRATRAYPAQRDQSAPREPLTRHRRRVLGNDRQDVSRPLAVRVCDGQVMVDHVDHRHAALPSTLIAVGAVIFWEPPGLVLPGGFLVGSRAGPLRGHRERQKCSEPGALLVGQWRELVDGSSNGLLEIGSVQLPAIAVREVWLIRVVPRIGRQARANTPLFGCH